MPDTPQTLADRLQGEAGRVIGFFKGLSQDQWRRRIYSIDDDWNLHQLLAHFVSAEIGRKELITSVAKGGEGAAQGFEIDSFNHREVERLAQESESDLLELFSHHRAELIEFVSTLQMEDLAKIENDPFLGNASLAEMIKITYLHLQIHLRDARQRM